MIENRRHIISRFGWNTCFDRKDHVGELQDRLSAWSRIKMPGEIDSAFDSLCPSGQVWKIQSLEIDLGTIGYDELEHELSARLHKKLTEKLTDLVLQSSGSENDIEIIDKDVSDVELIRHFLLHGVIPWNANKDNWSLNQLLADQLETNKPQIITMLRDIGATREKVRQRVAWQVNEPNIVELIKGLEPANYEQVVGFSDEMTRIQTKENIVGGGLADFKKSIWLGIFNYLLAERGTLFNQIAFIKSNLSQVAGHYNIGYDDLISIIQDAITKVEQHTTIKSGIIKVLKGLVREDSTDNSQSSDRKEEMRYGDVLNNYLNDPDSNDITIINDAIKGLFRKDQVKLRDLILSSAHDENKLWRITQQLNDSSFEAVFAAVSKQSDAAGIDYIHLLEKLCRQAGIDLDSKFLYHVSLSFLIEKKNSTFSMVEFLSCIIDKISKKKQLNKAEVIARLVEADLSTFNKNHQTLDLYTTLNQVFASELSKNSQEFFRSHFRTLLQQLEMCLKTNDQNEFVRIKSLISKYILLDPEKSHEVLTGDSFRRLLPYILDQRQVELLAQFDKNLTEALTKISGIQDEQTHSGLGRVYRLGAKKTTHAELFTTIEECLVFDLNTISRNGVNFDIRELLLLAAEINAAELRRIIKNIPFSERQVDKLQASVPFDQFCLFIGNDASGQLYYDVRTLKALYDLVTSIAPDSISIKLHRAFWKQLWQLIQSGNLSGEDFKKLVQDSLYHLAQEKNADSKQIISEILKKNLQLTPKLRDGFITYAEAFTMLPEVPGESSQLNRIEDKKTVYELTRHIILKKQIPDWFENTNHKQTAGELLSEVIIQYPEHLLIILKHEIIPEAQLVWVSKIIDIQKLIALLIRLNRSQQLALKNIELLFAGFYTIQIKGISQEEMRYLLFKKLIKTWTTSNWKIISPDRVWKELTWSLSSGYKIAARQLLQEIENARMYLSPSLKVSFDQLKNENGKHINSEKARILKQLKQMTQSREESTIIKEAIPVRNAGLVLINNYLAMLFVRLGLTNDQGFIDTEAQLRAVHYLQYFVTGLTRTEEHLLPLNKILCGLALVQPVADGIIVTEEHKDLIEGLIKAMIGQWPVIGDSSVDGFRGNWLVRDGLLSEQEDRWELTVEKRAYDILLQRSPFSFSIIKYPWMDKPLHVNWTY
jgi:hypothetical protein